MDKLQVDAVLEQVMQTAIAAGRAAAARAAAGDTFAQGQVAAYHDVMDVLKEQIELLGLVLAQRSLSDYDPDELLRLSAPAPKARKAA